MKKLVRIRTLPDTNTIIRYLVKDNTKLYSKSKELFDKVRDGVEKAIILESVIAECIYVLTKVYKVPKEKASYSLINILRYKGIVNNDKEDLIFALNLFSEKNIDIVDCILCAKASHEGFRLFSFDEELNSLSRQNL